MPPKNPLASGNAGYWAGHTTTASANLTVQNWYSNLTPGTTITMPATWATAAYVSPTPIAPSPTPPRPRQGFNRYVNGSDLLEEFIAFLGAEGVRKSEILGLPVELFIKWLVIRACELDQEEPGVVLTLPAPRAQPRCLGCGRWMARVTSLLLHGPKCASRHFARLGAA